jgi:hypothetical protein
LNSWIAHHNLCGAGANHPLNNLDHLADRVTAIDHVADENRSVIR